MAANQLVPYMGNQETETEMNTESHDKRGHFSRATLLYSGQQRCCRKQLNLPRGELSFACLTCDQVSLSSPSSPESADYHEKQLKSTHGEARL